LTESLLQVFKSRCLRRSIALLRRAQEGIRFVGPGLTVAAAKVLAERWTALGPSAVEVVLDADADLCRLGFCDGESLRLLSDAASRMNAQIHRQTGVRLCVLEIDGERIIFAPTPRLVEESKADVAEIVLSPSQGDSLHEQILAVPDLVPRPLTKASVEKVAADLQQSPAQPFNLARQVRILSFLVWYSIGQVQPPCLAHVFVAFDVVAHLVSIWCPFFAGKKETKPDQIDCLDRWQALRNSQLGGNPLWFSQTSKLLINWGLPFFLRFPCLPPLVALSAAFLAFFRQRTALQLEILALRHQLGVLQRSVKRPKLSADSIIVTSAAPPKGIFGVTPHGSVLLRGPHGGPPGQRS